jgi:hypothetical protein
VDGRGKQGKKENNNSYYDLMGERVPEVGTIERAGMSPMKRRGKQGKKGK